MARQFDGSTAYLETTSPPVTGYPCTLACRFLTYDGVNLQELMSVHNNLVVANRSAMDIVLAGSGSATKLRARRCSATANVNADTIQRYYPGVWNHAAAVFASDTNHEVYLNGVKGVTPAATSMILVGVNAFAIGRSPGITTSYMNGLIADAAVWSVALTAAEVARLAAGTDPRRIHAEALTFFRLRGNGMDVEQDLTRVYSLNNPTTTFAPVGVAHPPEIGYTAKRWLSGVPSTASFAPKAMHYYRQRRIA